MKKLVRDGNVAVIFHPTYGAGWYSWHGIIELLFDPIIVKMIEDNCSGEDIIDYCNKAYPLQVAGAPLHADDLDIQWIPEGSQFIIREYDGSEHIQLKEQTRWIIA